MRVNPSHPRDRTKHLSLILHLQTSCSLNSLPFALALPDRNGIQRVLLQTGPEIPSLHHELTLTQAHICIARVVGGGGRGQRANHESYDVMCVTEDEWEQRMHPYNSRSPYLD